MMLKAKLLLFICGLCNFGVVITVKESLSSQIPQYLRKCYDVDYERQNLQLPPFTTKTLVELIRKLEHNKTEPNIRLLSNAILHVPKFDGVQHNSVAGLSTDNVNVLPYRAIGYQFNRHRLLVDQLTPDINAELQFPPALDTNEFCLLHFMISSTLDLRLRNDEQKTCSVSYGRMGKQKKLANIIDSRTLSKGFEISDCPEQKGVIHTKWGTISPGQIIAGIASAFERTEIKTNDVDNVWVATLGGVLAQAMINQAIEIPRILSPGTWNDTILPRRWYLKGDHWDINNADILGALDGLILADEVRKWYHEFPAVSLSQLIETYYSTRGVAYDRSVRACEREKKLAQLFEKYDFVREVSAAARALLDAGHYKYALADSRIDLLAQGAVDQFKIAADSLMPPFEDCQESMDNTPSRMEVILVADHTYSIYEMERFLSFLVDAADVSHYSTSIGLIAGSSGTWLVNVTNDVLQIYADFSKTSRSAWPSGLTLSTCLLNIITFYQNISAQPCTPTDRPYGKVITILAQSSYLTDNDMSESTRLLDSLYNLVPELRVIIVTSSENARSFNELVAQTNNLILVSANNLEETRSQLRSELKKIPAGIVNFFCNGSQSTYEDYVTPDSDTIFEVHEKYSVLSQLSIKFQRIGYGEMSICAYNAKTPTNKTCRSTTTAGDEITFMARDQCAPCSLHFDVVANNTLPKCTAFACRRPDQVLIAIRTSWSSRGSPTRTATSCSILLSITLLLFNITRQTT